jgi:hypothetical protein
MPRRPNVLFILTDDQRYDTIHALGNPYIKTPNLDALCATGTAFTQAHIPGGSLFWDNAKSDEGRRFLAKGNLKFMVNLPMFNYFLINF